MKISFADLIIFLITIFHINIANLSAQEIVDSRKERIEKDNRFPNLSIGLGVGFNASKSHEGDLNSFGFAEISDHDFFQFRYVSSSGLNVTTLHGINSFESSNLLDKQRLTDHSFTFYLPEGYNSSLNKTITNRIGFSIGYSINQGSLINNYSGYDKNWYLPSGEVIPAGKDPENIGINSWNYGTTFKTRHLRLGPQYTYTNYSNNVDLDVYLNILIRISSELSPLVFNEDLNYELDNNDFIFASGSYELEAKSNERGGFYLSETLNVVGGLRANIMSSKKKLGWFLMTEMGTRSTYLANKNSPYTSNTPVFIIVRIGVNLLCVKL